MRGASGRAIGRGLSRTTNSNGIAASTSMAPPARKIARSPMKVAASPPAAAHASVRYEGVSALEKFALVEARLRQLERDLNAEVHPAFREYAVPYALSIGKVRAGAWAATVPELAPWMPRSTVSCSADWLRPIRPTEMPPPIMARISIGLRP